jgi:hypothetical protein
VVLGGFRLHVIVLGAVEEKAEEQVGGAGLAGMPTGGCSITARSSKKSRSFRVKNASKLRAGE